jgi:uncharacterized DUF497 family protein
MSNLRIDFEWDPKKEATNRTKHGVEFGIAMSVFRDPFAATLLDEGHGADEERWITLGEAANGSLILVVHTWAQTDASRARVRIISARRPTRREARQYREGRIDETGV